MVAQFVHWASLGAPGRAASQVRADADLLAAARAVPVVDDHSGARMDSEVAAVAEPPIRPEQRQVCSTVANNQPVALCF